MSEDERVPDDPHLGRRVARLGRRVAADDEIARRLVRERVRERLFNGQPHDGTTTGPVVGGRYRLEAPIGRGGIGAVYRAFNLSCDRPVALKRLLDTGTDAELRFRREFHTLARLRHPTIVEVYEYGIDESRPYYTMELLTGPELLDVEPLQANRCCEVLRDIASALAFLHMQSLIHCDVTPRNVRLSAGGCAKLIDFGMLATLGVVGNVVGTPPYIAPEVVRRQLLDHRADLFALGAVGYWALTGRHAFPARTLDELPTLWQSPPSPPSVDRSNIPKALDQLILALLDPDPLARPANAAEVADRLGAIGQLQPAPELEVARRCLTSSAMVGRDSEIALLMEAVERAVGGQGNAVLLEGASGVGKTRLLRELARHAQLQGATVVMAGEDAATGAFGLAREVGRALLTACPEGAVTAAREHAPLLVGLIPELSNHLPDVRPQFPRGDPVDQAVRLQEALGQWVLDVACLRPLVLLVDDLHCVEDASAAAVASLVQRLSEHRLLVVGTLRSDEPQRAPEAIALVRACAKGMRLEDLSQEGVTALVRAFFGEIPHAGRLAAALHAAVGGTPLLCTTIAWHLVERGTISSSGGECFVPNEIVLDDLPHDVAQAMDLKVSLLSATARRVAEALSIMGGQFSLATSLQLASDLSESTVFSALDELVTQEFLVSDGQRFRFRHDGLREAVMRGLSAERRKLLHLRAAQAVEAFAPEREENIGWHLFYGGQRLRGAQLLERVGRRLYDGQSLRDALGPLEGALTVYQEQQVMPVARVELLQMLMVAGSMVDRETALRYLDSSVQAAWRYSGLDLAQRLARVLGRPLAFVCGLTWAALRWAFGGRVQRGPSPFSALRTAVVVGLAATMCLAHMSHLRRLRTLLERFKALAVFRSSLAHAAYVLARAVLDLSEGRFDTVRLSCEPALRVVRHKKSLSLDGYDHRVAEATVLSTRASAALANQDPAFLVDIEAIEGLNVRSFDFCCFVLRQVYHRQRGEESRALEMERRAERVRLQARSSWMWEAWLCRLSSLAYGLTGDVPGLRRCIAELDRLCDSGHAFAQLAQLAAGEYHRERGAVEKSATILERLRASHHKDPYLRPYVLAALAECLFAHRDYSQAAKIAQQGSTLAYENGAQAVRLRCLRALALADASRGSVDSAVAILDHSLAMAAPLDSPSISGALHEAGAMVALLCGDQRAHRHHLQATEAWFRPTANPALIARIQRWATMHAKVR